MIGKCCVYSRWQERADLLVFFSLFFLISSGPSVWVCRSSIVPACSRAKMCCVMCYISADSFTAEETVSNPTAQQIIILHYISGRAGQLTSHFFVCLVPSLVSDCISQVIAWVQAFFLLRCYFIGQCACIHACMRTNGAKFKYAIIIDVWHVWPFFKWIDCFSFLVFFLFFFNGWRWLWLLTYSERLWSCNECVTGNWAPAFDG